MCLTNLEIAVFFELLNNNQLHNEELAERTGKKKRSIDTAVANLYKYGLIKDTYNYRRGRDRIIRIIGVVDYTSGAIEAAFLE
ncbi:helix-turn-helix domain-containing protein [Culicoidibacter larvae]|nr:helix-turn-helix domain-containing protein [Culicoidibacter larvae]